MSYLRDTAIILRQEPFRDYDGWITLYGKTHGKLEGVARGMYRPTSKQRGHLEPLHCVEVMIAKGIAFDKVAVVQSRSPQTDVRKKLSSVVLASRVASLADRVTREGMADESVFRCLQEALAFANTLPEEATRSRVDMMYLAIGYRLLSALGFVSVEGEVDEDLIKAFRFFAFAHIDDIARLTVSHELLQKMDTLMNAWEREHSLMGSEWGVHAPSVYLL
jgi:hypothetical protein